MLRADFTGSGASASSDPISVVVDRGADGAATTDVGPGKLNLLTGDYNLSATDASFFDMTLDGPWGGIVSGDRITVDYTPCKCGRTTLHIAKQVDRYSDLAGGDDKITCAATPGAQADALDFLTSLG